MAKAFAASSEEDIRQLLAVMRCPVAEALLEESINNMTIT